MHTPFILFLGDIGGSELMLIMVVILIFFGANKIPELARGLGKGIREFKDASTEIRREFEQADQPAPPNFGTQNQYPVPPRRWRKPVPGLTRGLLRQRLRCRPRRPPTERLNIKATSQSHP
jgi:TatA/E family protein of Tat protein translocase